MDRRWGVVAAIVAAVAVVAAGVGFVVLGGDDEPGPEDGEGAAIGQAEVTASPLHMATVAAGRRARRRPRGRAVPRRPRLHATIDT